MSELIDRQALLDEIWKMRMNYQMMDDTHTADKIMHGLYRAEQAVKEAPTIAAPRWVRVEEPPRDGQECIVAFLGPTDWIYEHATYHSDLNKALEEDIFIDGTDGFIVDGDVGYARHSFNYWMPIEPPKEEDK